MLASANINPNYNTHAYLAILLAHSSPLLADPSRIHPDLKHLGPVSLRYSSQPDPLTLWYKAGAIPDIHVFSVPKLTWESSSAAIINALRQTDGVLRVDVQEPRMRTKKGQSDVPLSPVIVQTKQ
jgi:hypothetical protein